MKLKFLVITLLTFFAGLAQNATIKGTVTDKDMNNETLPFATVFVKGTNISATTDESGNYSLSVPAGTHTIVFGFLGYQDAIVEVTVAAGETKTVDQQLHSDSVQLNDVVIEKTFNREKETALLLEQKTAVEIKQSIGAQELSRKGIGDVEEGLTKITGITKVGSRGLFVRGLEDRYNNLLVNGLAVPSNSPFQKIIPLDLFPTDIVGVVDVYKTFNPSIYGDFAGGTFNIATSKGTNAITKLSIGIGYTTDNNLSDFKISQDANSSKGFFGLTGKDRALPGIFGEIPSNRTLTSSESQKSFKSGFNVDSNKSPLNSSIGFLHSERFDLKDDSKLTYLLSLNFDNSYTVYQGVNRTLQGGDNTEIIYYNNFVTTDYRYKTNTSALVGTNYKNNRLDLSFTAFYLRNTENLIRDQFGVYENQKNNPNALIRTNQLDQSDYLTAQVNGKYFLTEDQNQFVRSGVSFSKTSYQQPDRKFFLGTKQSNNEILTSYGGNNFLRQYFDVSNNFYFSGMAEYGLKFGSEDIKQHQLTLGYNGNMSENETSYRFLSTFKAEGSPSNFTTNIDDIDTQINSDLASGNFNFRESSNAQYKSTLSEGINGGYGSLLLHFGEKWEINGGLRVEQAQREIKFRENGSFNQPFEVKKFDKTYILPSLSVKYGLNEISNLRFAAGKTYTRPVLVEMLAITYINADGTSLSGNPYLENSDNLNADLKYEVFPTSTEMFSIGVFGKKIKNVIDRTFQANAGGFITTFLNTGDATLYGAEIDFILDLARINQNLADFSWGFNTSLMDTNLKVNDFVTNSNGTRTATVETHRERQMQGASKWLINSDLKYQFKFSETWSNTVSFVYSVFGKRIYSVGSIPYDHIYELPVSRLDFVWSSKLSDHFDVKFSAHNILNPKVRFEVGDENRAEFTESSRIISDYKRGVGFSLGLNYTF
ncbi:carboxypeptidase-like regulatory domain-containing protein [Flavobacterium sp. DGU11]|uniref:Carboxypeptidase-like regulatory domain-containing protein n=1 Tax=Flavobacterium arundinis TaxID=3139143 RepID=A0ABU9HZL2_9FLAO